VRFRTTRSDKRFANWRIADSGGDKYSPSVVWTERFHQQVRVLRRQIELALRHVLAAGL
jgi:hypothetical protein